MGLGPQDLIADLNTFGLLFEIMCIRDLSVFADTLNGKVYHFRDKIDTTKMKAPSFLMVLIGVGDYAYRRQDGSVNRDGLAWQNA